MTEKPLRVWEYRVRHSLALNRRIVTMKTVKQMHRCGQCIETKEYELIGKSPHVNSLRKVMPGAGQRFREGLRRGGRSG